MPRPGLPHHVFNRTVTAVRRSLVAGCLLSVLLVGSPTAHGDDPAEVDELRTRVEDLERTNSALIRALQRERIFSLPGDPDPSFDSSAAEDDETLFRAIADDRGGKKAEGGDNKDKPKLEDEWYEVGSDTAMTASWHNGLELSTKNKDFRVHIGGRNQFDGALFAVPAAVEGDPTLRNPIRDGVDFRRARLRVDGTMWEQIEWAAEFDFVNSAGASPSFPGVLNAFSVVAPTDLWWTFTKLPVIGNLRVGNQKEAIGFEHLTSSRFLNFMERSFNQDAFYGGFFNGFSPGIAIFDTMLEERGTWNIGLYKPGNNVFAASAENGLYSITGRLTWLPWYVDEGQGLVHLGFSARHAGLENNAARIRTRGPERAGLSANWPLYADTGFIDGNSRQSYNAELVGVLGSWTFAAEYLVEQIHAGGRIGQPSVGTLTYGGGYVEVLYFLTGETREYKRTTAVFDRVVPHENAFLLDGEGDMVAGLGAWQVGARYNYLNLNDKGIDGGILNDWTLGLNWFLNPNMKVQFNYSATDRQSVLPQHDGVINAWGVRLAHDF